MYFTNIFSAGEQVLVQDRALTQHRPAQFQRNVFLSNTDPIKRACVDRQTRPQTHTHTHTHTRRHFNPVYTEHPDVISLSEDLCAMDCLLQALLDVEWGDA